MKFVVLASLLALTSVSAFAGSEMGTYSCQATMTMNNGGGGNGGGGWGRRHNDRDDNEAADAYADSLRRRGFPEDSIQRLRWELIQREKQEADRLGFNNRPTGSGIVGNGSIPNQSFGRNGSNVIPGVRNACVTALSDCINQASSRFPRWAGYARQACVVTDARATQTNGMVFNYAQFNGATIDTVNSR